MKNYISILLIVLFLFITVVSPQVVEANVSAHTIFVPIIVKYPPATSDGPNTYYMSPTGNDNNSGKTEAQPFATFNRAWQALYPGYTLVLLDGVYHQTLNPNVRDGTPGNPITIKARNDGKAIIDGDYVREPVKLGDTWPGPIGNYFDIEGIIARNSSNYVIEINAAHNNIFRRVTAYNADTNGNSAVIAVNWAGAHDNLIEDCVASGTARKMIMIYEGVNNIIRRCYVDWQAWDGRNFCGVTWPFGDGIQVYGGSYNILENNVVAGLLPDWAVSVQANDLNATAVGNRIYGTIALRAGMNPNGSVKKWDTIRPQANSCPQSLTDFTWPGWRSGFMLYGQGVLKDNLFQDIFAWGNAGLGLTTIPGTTYNPANSNNKVVRATISGNGIDNPDGSWGASGGKGTDALASELSHFSSVEDSKIGVEMLSWPNYYNGGVKVTTSTNGTGALLTNQYINGSLTSTALWPWPMEQRIRTELGISVTNTLAGIIPAQIHPIP